MGYGTFKVQGQ